jgi:hypothetical protein
MENNPTSDDEEINRKILMITRQTNYSQHEAREKLLQFNNNPIAVIQNYMGIAEKKAPKIKSVNQAIYRELRNQLDSSIKSYNDKKHEELQKEFNK